MAEKRKYVTSCNGPAICRTLARRGENITAYSRRELRLYYLSDEFEIDKLWALAVDKVYTDSDGFTWMRVE